MDNSPNAPAIEPTDITADTPCRSCQYNLRGLRSDGLCPECATPVAVSIRDDRLANANPVWVCKLRLGVLLGIWSMISFVPLGFAASLAPALFQIPGFAECVALGLTLTPMAGMWLLTTPDPSGMGENRYGTNRKFVRVTLLFWLLDEFVFFAMKNLFSAPSRTVGEVIVSDIFGVLFVVGHVASLNYLSKLALCIHDVSIARKARFLTFAIGIVSGLSFLENLVFTTWSMGRVPANFFLAYASLEAIFTPLCGIGILVFGVMELLMLLNLSGRLREAAQLAEPSRRPAEQHTPPM